MRSFLFAIALFASSAVSASACPNLDGHFTCTYDGQFGHKVFELDGKTLSDARGQTYYVVNEKEVYTDGQPHHTDSLPILEEWADDVNYVGTCTSDNTIHIKGDANLKKYSSRADLEGDIIKNPDSDLSVSFNVNLGFFSTDIQVPCVHK